MGCGCALGCCGFRFKVALTVSTGGCSLCGGGSEAWIRALRLQLDTDVVSGQGFLNDAVTLALLAFKS